MVPIIGVSLLFLEGTIGVLDLGLTSLCEPETLAATVGVPLPLLSMLRLVAASKLCRFKAGGSIGVDG